ncbi:hypothetical protein Ancab_017473 [Ancistrocladus abbreviatus]
MFGLWKSSCNGSPKASAIAAVASPSSNMIKPNLRDPLIPMEPQQGKRALICGVSYKKQKYKLKGTIIDVYKMKDFLEYRYGFLEHSIKILVDLLIIAFRFGAITLSRGGRPSRKDANKEEHGRRLEMASGRM